MFLVLDCLAIWVADWLVMVCLLFLVLDRLAIWLADWLVMVCLSTSEFTDSCKHFED